MLPRTSDSEALECAERLHRRIAGHAFIDDLPELVVTATFGVATAVDGDDPERLLARADAALGEARRLGRDHCVRPPRSIRLSEHGRRGTPPAPSSR